VAIDPFRTSGEAAPGPVSGQNNPVQQERNPNGELQMPQSTIHDEARCGGAAGVHSEKKKLSPSERDDKEGEAALDC